MEGLDRWSVRRLMPASFFWHFQTEIVFMNKQTLRIAALCAGLTLSSFTGLSFAADDAPAKPAATATTTPPTTQRVRRSPADMIKNYRDQFEGLSLIHI